MKPYSVRKQPWDSKDWMVRAGVDFGDCSIPKTEEPYELGWMAMHELMQDMTARKNARVAKGEKDEFLPDERQIIIALCDRYNLLNTKKEEK